MPFWRRKTKTEDVEDVKVVDTGGLSLDEFLGKGQHRAASPFDVSEAAKRWQAHLKDGALFSEARRALALPAFNLIRGGDLFERKTRPPRTEAALLDRYAERQLALHPAGAALEEREAALQGVLRVLSGSPAICMRMMLVKPIDLFIIPKGEDYRRFGFPKSTNPRAAGIFYVSPSAPRAMIGLREERILEKPWLMVHEMAHAVHLLGMSAKEREDIDRMLMPVYQSQRWIEEALAIYAERAFGARYDEDDLRAPGLYGKTRRDWNERHVFSRFVIELFQPG